MDVAQLKAAATGRWRDILTSLAGIDDLLLDGKHHPCPRCGGIDRFRMLNEEAGALLCNQCFADKNGDGIAAVQWMTGTTFPEALRRISEYLGINGHPNEHAEQGNGLIGMDWLVAKAK